MERKIGETFHYNGRTIVCEKCLNEDNPCKGCIFDGLNENGGPACTKPDGVINTFGSCYKWYREDYRDVKFLEVKKDKQNTAPDQKCEYCVTAIYPNGEKHEVAGPYKSKTECRDNAIRYAMLAVESYLSKGNQVIIHESFDEIVVKSEDGEVKKFEITKREKRIVMKEMSVVSRGYQCYTERLWKKFTAEFNKLNYEQQIKMIEDGRVRRVDGDDWIFEGTLDDIAQEFDLVSEQA